MALACPDARRAGGGVPLCRSRLTFGEGVLPTSVLFAPTSLFQCVPMDEDLPRHCDLDWLIRVDAQPDVALHMPEERTPLAIWHLAGHDRMSKAHDWRFSYDWIARCRPMVTPRAYAGFLLTWASFSARSQGDFRAVPLLLKEAVRHGRPGARDSGRLRCCLVPADDGPCALEHVDCEADGFGRFRLKRYPPKVMFIGLDAASRDLVLDWCNEGVLPHLQSLRKTSAWGMTHNAPAVYTGSLWPSVWTGTTPGRHGCYYNEQIDPGT